MVLLLVEGWNEQGFMCLGLKFSVGAISSLVV